MRPRQNGRLSTEDICTCIFLNDNAWISINISLKFVPKGTINNIPALIQMMAWRRPGDKPLSEPMMFSLLTHIWVTRPQSVKCIHYMMASWHGTAFRISGLLWKESSGHRLISLTKGLLIHRLDDFICCSLDKEGVEQKSSCGNSKHHDNYSAHNSVYLHSIFLLPREWISCFSKKIAVSSIARDKALTPTTVFAKNVCLNILHHDTKHMLL